MKNKKTLALVAAALVVIGAASVQPAMAYFTSYKMASGYREINVHDSELGVPEDTVDLGTMIKTVQITNTGDFDVYVRVKAICPNGISAEVVKPEGDDEVLLWTKGEDDYYYYKDILPAKEENTTNKLNLEIKTPEGYDKDFNVIIVQEATKVHYDQNGDPYADWTKDVIQAQEFSKGGEN